MTLYHALRQRVRTHKGGGLAQQLLQRLGNRLGGILLDSNLGRSVAACGGGKVDVYGLCMAFGVHTAKSSSRVRQP